MCIRSRTCRQAGRQAGTHERAGGVSMQSLALAGLRAAVNTHVRLAEGAAWIPPQPRGERWRVVEEGWGGVGWGGWGAGALFA